MIKITGPSGRSVVVTVIMSAAGRTATGLGDAARSVWGKTDRTGASVVGWLPLWRHLADAADVAGRLWDHWLSPAVRCRIAEELPEGDASGRTLAVWLAGVHDVGKATPAFAVQASFRSQTAALVGRMRDRGLGFDHETICASRRLARHDAAGHVVLAEWLREQDWTDPHAYAVVVGGHHGIPPTDEVLNGVLLRRHLLGDEAWQQVLRELLAWMTDRSGAGDQLSGWAGAPLSQPVQAALTGLVIVADWIASNEKFFPYLLDAADEDRLRTGWEAVDLPVPWQPAQPPAGAAELFATDLAPVDLVLQRIGRLHRHPRDRRPAALAAPTCWITGADWSVEPPEPVAGSRRLYQPAALLRSAAVLLPNLDGAPLRLPADIAVLTQSAYGEAEVGPQAWQAALAEAETKQREAFAAKELKADGFRLAGVAERGVPLIGWLSGGVGDADDQTARGHVRDTDGETLEVLLLVRAQDGLVIPPWIDGGGVPVPTSTMPAWRLARQIARCTLPLPRSMTATDVIDETIAELERRVDVTAWQESPWLAGELVLDIDRNGLARVGSFDLHYDHHEGLRAVRND